MEIRPSMASTIARAPQIKIDKLAEEEKRVPRPQEVDGDVE